MWPPFHLKKLQEAHPGPSNRNFALFFAFVFGLLFWGKGRLVFAELAVFCALGAFVCPKVFTLPNYLWHNLGLFLGWLMTPVMLTLLYFVGFVPMALLVKLSGHKAFLLKGGWVEKKKSARFERIF